MISNQSNFLGENLKKIDDPGKKSTKKSASYGAPIKMSKCIISQRFSLPKATICLLEKNTIENLNNCVIYLYRNYFFTVKRNDDLRLHMRIVCVFLRSSVFVKKNCRLRHKKTSLFLKDFQEQLLLWLINKMNYMVQQMAKSKHSVLKFRFLS